MREHEAFYQILRHKRLQEGWSQEYLAGILGVDLKTVNRWESGNVLPRPQYRQKLYEHFHTNAEEMGLLEGKEIDATALHEDWGLAPRLTHLCGRIDELTTLKRWALDDGCRVIVVLGMGGIGKTVLTARLAEQIKDSFEYIFWRSLQDVLPVELFLDQCIQRISGGLQSDLPEGVNAKIALLIAYLRSHRCLLILDNVEAIFQSRQHAGIYDRGSESYGQLIQHLAETQHQSCLLMTSREKPEEVARLEGDATPLRSYHLGAVSTDEGKEILSGKGLEGTDEQWHSLIQHYSGNPLALQLISQPIREVFGGNIGRFLAEGEITFGSIHRLLDQHFYRLSKLEQEILYWLAIEREAVSLNNLHENLVSSIARRLLLDAIDSLRRRSMIERPGHMTFTLQPVIMEYMTNTLVDYFVHYFSLENSDEWSHYALIKAQSSDYIRDSQIHLILAPVADRLRLAQGEVGIEQTLKTMLMAQQQAHPLRRNYLAGNALNLLIYLQRDLRGWNFSHLVIRQAYLQNAMLPALDFSYATFLSSVFAHTLGNVLSVTFNAHDDLLAAGTTTGEIWMYDVTRATPLFICSGHTDAVWSVAFSQDGAVLVSCSDDQSIRLWDIKTGCCLKVLHGHTNRVRSVAFSPDKSLLASGSEDHTIRLWDSSTGQCVMVLRGHVDRVWSVTFSPDGLLLASASTDHTICIWDVKTGQVVNILRDHSLWVLSLAFNTDGSLLASGSSDQTIRLWDYKTNRCLNVLYGHTRGVRTLCFSRDGSLLASGSEDQTIRLWNTETAQCVKVLQGHSDGVRSVVINSDGSTLASSADDQTIRFWDISLGRCLKTLQGHAYRIWSIAYNQAGTLLVSCSEDRTIRLWDVVSATCVRVLHDPDHKVRCIAVSRDGRVVVSGGEDHTVRLWDTASGYCLKTLRGHTGWIRSIALSADEHMIISGGEDHTVRLWNVDTGQCLKVLQGHVSWVRTVAINPDNTMLASGGDDQTLRLWDTTTGHVAHTPQGHTGQVRAVTFSPDGSLLASGSEDRTICLWDAHTGAALNILHGHAGWVRTLAFNAAGSLLASSGEDQTIKLWDVRTGNCLKTLHGHTNRVRRVIFSPTDHILASCSDDGSIKLWDVQTAECVRTILNERPYEHMNITQVQGLIEAQKVMLRTLGATETSPD